mmetsp:Transcript_34459/g.91291  ORF Transcript_34459/g.91291 Transcript_34459/m.91291 type:complete len:561 (+) Transcript_34459:215-1897(+)
MGHAPGVLLRVAHGRGRPAEGGDAEPHTATEPPEAPRAPPESRGIERPVQHRGLQVRAPPARRGLHQGHGDQGNARDTGGRVAGRRHQADDPQARGAGDAPGRAGDRGPPRPRPERRAREAPAGLPARGRDLLPRPEGAQGPAGRPAGRVRADAGRGDDGGPEERRVQGRQEPADAGAPEGRVLEREGAVQHRGDAQEGRPVPRAQGPARRSGGPPGPLQGAEAGGQRRKDRGGRCHQGPQGRDPAGLGPADELPREEGGHRQGVGGEEVQAAAPFGAAPPGGGRVHEPLHRGRGAPHLLRQPGSGPPDDPAPAGDGRHRGRDGVGGLREVGREGARARGQPPHATTVGGCRGHRSPGAGGDDGGAQRLHIHRDSAVLHSGEEHGDSRRYAPRGRQRRKGAGAEGEAGGAGRGIGRCRDRGRDRQAVRRGEGQHEGHRGVQGVRRRAQRLSAARSRELHVPVQEHVLRRADRQDRLQSGGPEVCGEIVHRAPAVRQGQAALLPPAPGGSGGGASGASEDGGRVRVGRRAGAEAQVPAARVRRSSACERGTGGRAGSGERW